jgi:uncharacterized iron-regulated membrane protein
MKTSLRKFARWSHAWLGLITGVFICLMGFTGGLVGLRPQLATLLSPSAPRDAGCVSPVDWNKAANDLKAFDRSEINRIYGPYGSDTRYHIRMATDNPILFHHLIYDACSGKVLGSINFGWMDWTVDLHHNLLNGRTGRLWAGAIGIVMLLSGLSGLLVWLLAKPSLGTAFRIQLSWSRRTPRELHRAFGIGAALLLALEAFTGVWLAFPQAVRGALALVASVPEDVRPARGGRDKSVTGHATLGDLMAAARTAIPDGFVREIRMPEGNGNVQIRMWRPGDFRILGNNVVYVSGANARVLAVDRYAERSGASRFSQAMAALHYDEWGGLGFRILCSLAGLVTPVLFISGIFLWWYSRPRKLPSAPRPSQVDRESALTH